MAEKKVEIIEAWIDLLDLTKGKEALKKQIEKRKESIDYFVEKKKKLEAVKQK